MTPSAPTLAANLPSQAPLGRIKYVAAHQLTQSQRVLLRASIICSALMSYVPDSVSFFNVSFVGFCGLFFLVSLPVLSARLLQQRAASALLFFFALFAFNFPVALSEETGVGEWVRGAIPFVFLSVHLGLVPVDMRKDGEFILNTLHLAAIAWAVKILILAGPALSSVIFGSVGRLTLLVEDTLIPYGLTGFLLSLFNPSPVARRWQWVTLPTFLILVVLCGYRSQLIICGIATLLYLKRARVATTLIWGAFGLMVLAPTLPALLNNSLGQTLEKRFARATEEQGGRRFKEVEFALDSAFDSPLLGKGLGYPIPTWVIQEEMERVGTSRIAYIHNVWAYLLMDFGFPGFFAYVVFIGSPMWHGWRAGRRTDHHSTIRYCAAVTLAFLMIYTTCQAAFRGIQFNLMLALLTAVAAHTGAIAASQRLAGQPPQRTAPAAAA